MYEIGEEEVQAVARVIRSTQLFRYPAGARSECHLFESELAARLGCEYALAVNSGTSALICALVACDIGAGDEVIVPAFTFMATALAVLAVGAVPVVAEIDESLTLDPQALEARISSRTKAIIAVHMLGLPCDMDSIVAAASPHGLRVIEDACQAVGASYRGRPAGTIGDAGALSFNQFKIISAGEGGAMVTRGRELYDKAVIQHDDGAAFRQHACQMSVPIFTGGNYRISEITGAILRVQLSRLDGILKRLRERKRAFVESIGDPAGLALAPVRCADGECGMYVVIQLESQERMRRILPALRRHGIAAATPADSPGHVYTGWKPIVDLRAGHHSGRNPFHQTGVHYDYSKACCPIALDVLARTIVVPIDMNDTLEAVRNKAKQVRRIAGSTNSH
jgi:dTDP-4-amino-4,6-dideoxygalactose transaminase